MTTYLKTTCPPVDCTRAADDLIRSSAEYLRQVNSYGNGVRMYVALATAIVSARQSIRNLEEQYDFDTNDKLPAAVFAKAVNQNQVLAGLMQDQASALTALGRARGYLRRRSNELAAERRALLDLACTDSSNAHRRKACERYELTKRDLAGPGLEKFDAMLAAAMG
jgi:hypothetical protein